MIARKILSYLMTLLLCISSAHAFAQVPDFSNVQNKDAKKYLPAGMAFQMSGHATGKDQYTLTWRIAQGYYLYKDRMKIVANNGATISSIKWSTAAQTKDDPNFGQVQVFHSQAIAQITVNTSQVKTGNATLNVQYQGCAEGGLCYPPMNGQVVLTVSNATPSNPTADTNSTLTQKPTSPADTAQKGTKNESVDGAGVVTNIAVAPKISDASVPNVQPALQDTVPATTAPPNFSTLDISNPNAISTYLSRLSLPVVFGVLLLLGLGLGFTPCVYPMMPILMSIIAGERAEKLSASRGFKLSLAYVLGMAMVYTILGGVMSALGTQGNVALWLQKPVVIIASAVLFAFLALSMFGVFTLQLPSGLQNRLNQLSHNQKGGRFTGAFLMGMFSALVVSPCITGPLIGVIYFISSVGKVVFGALALFTLAIGMGIPLIVLGSTGGRFLPKSGAWMNAIKGLFGLGLLAVAIGLLARLIPDNVTMVLWSLLCAGAAVMLGVFSSAPNTIAKFVKALGVLLLIYAIALLIGALSGQTNPLKPLSLSTQSVNTKTQGMPFKTITTIDALNAELAQAKQAGKPVVLDLAADWCTACKDMERTTFMDAQVVAKLSPYTALRLDITDTTDAHRAWMQAQGIFGPPNIQFFDAQGKEISRITGEANAAEFLQKISR